MQRLEPSFLRYFIYNSAWVSAMDTLATGTLLTAYALALGASSWLIGCLGALPYMGTAASMLGAYFVYKGMDAKKITLIFSYASRPFYLFGALLAFFPSASWAAIGLAWVIALCYFTGGISSGSYYPWLKSVLPAKQTYLFVQRKYTASMGAHIGGFLSAFVFMKYWSDLNGNLPCAIYAILFCCACICGLIGTACLGHIPGSAKPCQVPIPAFKYIRITVWHYKWFLTVCIVILGSLLFMNTFVPVFVLQIGKWSVTWMTGLAVLGQFSFLLSLPWWKKMNEKTYSLCSCQVSFTILCILLSGLIFSLPLMTPKQVMTCSGVFFVLSFITQAGIQAGLDGAVLLEAPKRSSSVFFAAVSCAKLIAALGPAMAGIVWALLNQMGNAVNLYRQWQFFFLLCVCIQIIAVIACISFEKRMSHGKI